MTIGRQRWGARKEKKLYCFTKLAGQLPRIGGDILAPAQRSVAGELLRQPALEISNKDHLPAKAYADSSKWPVEAQRLRLPVVNSAIHCAEEEVGFITKAYLCVCIAEG